MVGMAGTSAAQDADTTRQNLEFQKGKRRSLDLRQHSERSMSGGIMSDMGTYDIPQEGQYYARPFKGQYYLDKAVEEYRKELEEQIGGDWFWQFLRAVSPYIRLQLGPLYRPELQYVDRDNPLWRSYTDDSKKQ